MEYAENGDLLEELNKRIPIKNYLNEETIWMIFIGVTFLLLIIIQY